MSREDKSTQLPWEALEHTKGDIPWSALEQFANAVGSVPSVTDMLIDMYEESFDLGPDHFGYVDLYVPAIFALASANLNDRQRHKISRFLLDELVEAGRNDDDLLLEVLTAACGSMGPSVIPLVLDAIAKEGESRDGWYHLWNLTELAADTDDAELRNLVAQACVDVLQRADQNEVELGDVMAAAWSLAALKRTEYIPLLRSLKNKAAGHLFCLGDFTDALKLMEGRLGFVPMDNMWKKPVREWFEPRWRIVRDWYAEGDEIDSGDNEEETLGHIRDITHNFLTSSLARELSDELLEDADFIVYNLLEHALVFAGTRPEQLSESVLSEVLLVRFPRKITGDRDFFEKVAPVGESFLKWLESEGILTHGSILGEKVRTWHDAIIANGMNSRNWGMAKTCMMQAQASGVDIGDEDASRTYFAENQLRQLEQRSGAKARTDNYQPPIPIVSHSPKVGRNAPCPCGSGRKYKKCCLNAKDIASIESKSS